jgi:hypothetical protein
MEIDGPIYIERINASQITNEPDLKFWCSVLALNFEIRRESDNRSFGVRWDTDYVDVDASIHVEKWIERIGLHFQDYTFATHKPPVPGETVPASIVNSSGEIERVAKLKVKSFSGDVSGSIAEALFASLLKQRYGIGSWDFTHLRATTERAPDFYIRTVTQQLANDLDSTSPTVIGVPLIAEVKGATAPSRHGIADKLEDAVSQVQKLRSNGLYGIACVFLRDPIRGRYHGMVVVVRP